MTGVQTCALPISEGEAFVYSRLGELELSLDNYKEAEKALRQSTALVENYIDGQNTYGEALIKLSKVQTASGEDEKALQTIKKAQEVTAATDNKNLLGDAYEQEAYICLLNNKEQQALEKYRLAADLFNQDGTTLKEADRKSTRLNSSHITLSRMPSSA